MCMGADGERVKTKMRMGGSAMDGRGKVPARGRLRGTERASGAQMEWTSRRHLRSTTARDVQALHLDVCKLQ